jgi:hypothetical protein
MNIIQECENACKKGVHEGLKNLYKEQEHKEAIGDEYTHWLEARISFLTETLAKIAIDQTK